MLMHSFSFHNSCIDIRGLICVFLFCMLCHVLLLSLSLSRSHYIYIYIYFFLFVDHSSPERRKRISWIVFSVSWEPPRSRIIRALSNCRTTPRINIHRIHPRVMVLRPSSPPWIPPVSICCRGCYDMTRHDASRPRRRWNMTFSPT
jgi:hypothetical protein